MLRLPKIACLAAVLAGSAALAVAEPAPPVPPEIKSDIKFKPGSGFTIVNGEDFSLQVTGRLQGRWTYENFDDEKDIPNVSAFTAHRARFGAKGTMFKDWKFEFQAEFARSIQLRDAVITWERMPELAISMGQYKVRYDRQQYVSSGRQMFVDRSIASSTFGLSRDVGLMFSGAPWQKKLQWNVGVFDGQGIPGSASTPTATDVNRNDGHLYVARVSINPNGDFGLSESDIKKTDYHLWYVDLAAYWNNDIWVDGNSDKKEQPGELTDNEGLTFGFGYRHAGFFLSGEYFDRDVEKEDGTGMVDSDGWYAQLGYMLVRDKWEIAARYSEVDPNDDNEDDKRTETMLGFNRYFKGAGHSLKLNNDLSWLEEEKVSPADDLEDFRFRSQIQIVF
jgi:phosphate-selective porin OprO/OprP